MSLVVMGKLGTAADEADWEMRFYCWEWEAGGGVDIPFWMSLE
jgi:hypothetical protein